MTDAFQPYVATYKWDGGFSPMEKYDGQEMTIERPLRPEEVDDEVGPMFLARFPDGTSQDIYADEIVSRTPDHDDLEFARETLGPEAPDDEVENLANLRNDRNHKEN